MEGEVYTCGNGEKGQLGFGLSSLKEYRPCKVKLELMEDRIKQIACGHMNTGFLTGKISRLILIDRGHVYICGDNSKG